jgi:phosphoglycolate phosphatase
MDISKIKAVVFDCDGVMFDTAEANRKYYDEVLSLFTKPPLTQEQFVMVHMMTVKAAIEYLFPEKKDLTQVFECLKNIGYHKFIKYMIMETGLRELLSNLKKNHLIRGVATNRTNTMEKVLADYNLDDDFEVVITAAKVKKPKPDPECLNVIKDQFRLKSRQIIFIGDSEYDQIAAQKADTWFISFKSENLKGDFNVKTMDEIAGILKIN